MTYFPDLKPFTYVSRDADILAVGWLEAYRSFPRGPVPPELPDLLLRMAAHPHNQTRGFHLCNLCPRSGRKSREYLLANGRRIRTPQLIIQKDGQDFPLGNGEIIVRGPGRTYAAPTLIYHYVTRHGYQPPAEFVQAALAQASSQATET